MCHCHVQPTYYPLAKQMTKRSSKLPESKIFCIAFQVMRDVSEIQLQDYDQLVHLDVEVTFTNAPVNRVNLK